MSQKSLCDEHGLGTLSVVDAADVVEGSGSLKAWMALLYNHLEEKLLLFPVRSQWETKVVSPGLGRWENELHLWEGFFFFFPVGPFQEINSSPSMYLSFFFNDKLQWFIWFLPDLTSYNVVSQNEAPLRRK